MNEKLSLNDSNALTAISSSASSPTSTPITIPSPPAPDTPGNHAQPFATLDHYIALGSLSFRKHFAQDTHLYVDGEWIELLSHDVTFSDELLADFGPHVVKLLRAQWVRLFIKWFQDEQCTRIKILLLPEDVGQVSIDKSGYRLRQSLRHTIQRLSHEDDGVLAYDKKPFYPYAAQVDGQDCSLWYLFNVIPSPQPEIEKPLMAHDRQAMRQLLSEDEEIEGLKTRLYPFQARSAAFMIQKETTPGRYLDPRFERRVDQEGKPYFYSPKDLTFLHQSRYYEDNRGGILAESMGLGKTIICIAVILATRQHLPRVPDQYLPPPTSRPKTASLFTMAAYTAVRHSLPWGAALDKYEANFGVDTSTWRRELNSIEPIFEIPVEPVRFNRNPTKRQPRRLLLCRSTLIVVPRPLFDQWKGEIEKHVDQDLLRVLFIDKPQTVLPSAAELADYDIVLFSKTRFQLEIRDGEDVHGRRSVKGPRASCTCPYIGSTRTRDCTCFKQDEIYTSPLKQLYWLRIIVDEGHAFSSSDANAVRVADQLEAERRWVVSGTPARGLVGVDIDQTTMDFTDDLTAEEMRAIALEGRKGFSGAKEEAESAKSIGLLASKFLKVHPWAFSTTEGAAKWDEYIYRHEDPSKRTFSGYTACLSRTLERLIIKTRPTDVERDLMLPPLTHNIVRLEPSYFDKMTNNLFVQVMRGNAITSERVGRDYLFHKDNEKPRHDLIRNLRNASFQWTGFSETDIHSTIDVCTKYLEKEDTLCSQADRDMLNESLAAVGRLLDSTSWKAMSSTHELGFYVESWPPDFQDIWALDSGSKPGLFGVERLYQAQIHVNSLEVTDALATFNSAAIKARERLLPALGITSPSPVKSNQIEMARTGVPLSSITDQTGNSGRRTALKLKRSPMKTRKKGGKKTGVVARVATARPEEAVPNAKKRKQVVAADGNNGPVKTKKPKVTFADGNADPARDSSDLSLPSATLNKIVGFALDDGAEPDVPSGSQRIGGSVIDTRRPNGSADDRTKNPTGNVPLLPHTEMNGSLQSQFSGSSSTINGILDQVQLKSSLPVSTIPDELMIDQATNLDALNKARVAGTTSAKATYLIDKFVQYCPTEKILVFFDCVTTARYIQDILDFLHIGSRHFAHGLKPEERSKNKDAFQHDPRIRVLLIDVKLGGEGLDLNAASIVLIVNPICQPALEAQAIKRAHRIGQKKRVLVETLLLKGTIEEQMFERSKSMTQQEFRDGFARNDGIKELLLNASVIPVTDDEAQAVNAIAKLAVPQKVFMRDNYKDFEIDIEEMEKEIKNGSSGVVAKGKGKSKKGPLLSNDLPDDDTGPTPGQVLAWKGVPSSVPSVSSSLHETVPPTVPLTVAYLISTVDSRQSDS